MDNKKSILFPFEANSKGSVRFVYDPSEELCSISKDELSVHGIALLVVLKFITGSFFKLKFRSNEYVQAENRITGKGLTLREFYEVVCTSILASVITRILIFARLAEKKEFCNLLQAVQKYLSKYIEKVKKWDGYKKHQFSFDFITATTQDDAEFLKMRKAGSSTNKKARTE